ncbi:MAG: hypothetical protein AAFW70_20840, partial [Cyanobacteria bacterium J06635_10]
MTPTESDVKRIEEALAENPTDTNLMNSLALGYLSNPNLLQDREILKLLEKAYQTKKTIKSTHNLAWFYYEEYGATLERAIEIQSECISMNPKSFYPYVLYGYMLLQNQQPLEAIKPLEIAYSKMPRRDIANNLGIAYAKDGNFHKAKYYLIKASNEDDIENISKYNLAIVKIQLEEQEDALEIARELKQIIADKPLSDAIDAFEVAYLYYLLNDCDRAYSCCKMCDWNIYDLFSWKYIPYLIYQNDLKLYQELVSAEIEKKKTWIRKINDNHQDWEDDSEEEK